MQSHSTCIHKNKRHTHTIKEAVGLAWMSSCVMSSFQGESTKLTKLVELYRSRKKEEGLLYPVHSDIIWAVLTAIKATETMSAYQRGKIEDGN